MARPPCESASRASQDRSPQVLRVGTERIGDQVARGYDRPGTPLELILELAWRPACVAGVDAQRLQMRDQDVGGGIEIDDPEGADHATEALRLVHILYAFVLKERRVESRQPEGAVQRHRSALEEVRRTREVITPAGQH